MGNILEGDCKDRMADRYLQCAALVDALVLLRETKQLVQ